MRHHSSLVEIGKLWVSLCIYFFNEIFKKNNFIRMQFAVYWISKKAWSKRKESFNLARYCNWLNSCSSAPVVFQGNLHDKYGQLVFLYSKLLCTKLEFHVKVRGHRLSYVTPHTMSPRCMQWIIEQNVRNIHCEWQPASTLQNNVSQCSVQQSHRTWRLQMKSWSALQGQTLIMCEFLWSAWNNYRKQHCCHPNVFIK